MLLIVYRLSSYSRKRYMHVRRLFTSVDHLLATITVAVIIAGLRGRHSGDTLLLLQDASGSVRGHASIWYKVYVIPDALHAYQRSIFLDDYCYYPHSPPQRVSDTHTTQVCSSIHAISAVVWLGDFPPQLLLAHSTSPALFG
jgi:hypothetical protein